MAGRRPYYSVFRNPVYSLPGGAAIVEAYSRIEYNDTPPLRTLAEALVRASPQSPSESSSSSVTLISTFEESSEDDDSTPPSVDVLRRVPAAPATANTLELSSLITTSYIMFNDDWIMCLKTIRVDTLFVAHWTLETKDWDGDMPICVTDQSELIVNGARDQKRAILQIDRGRITVGESSFPGDLPRIYPPKKQAKHVGVALEGPLTIMHLGVGVKHGKRWKCLMRSCQWT
eukprot:Blabericola_migrator_1__6659@NODE_3360_length_1831_cov_41_238095_g2096_i0_p2_GENE_NODE_3360_length_1831_cov_41_238095_g2096_i0NODE_3360_length_1831_cov_41_238095_g2096_i0_p2_ORF_typecomplete_len231_score23_42_NODE_3360_length_1831_cov_41_238095_g2096_i04696